MEVTIKKLKELFGADRVTAQPTFDEQDFLKRRADIAKNLSRNLSIKEFLILRLSL